MKRKFYFSLLIGFALALTTSKFNNAYSQTAGTLSFTVNPVSHSGNWGLDHFVAIWLENSSTSFVKTKLKNADSHGTSNHLLVWKAKSALNVVDATVGASLASYNPLTISWNGTDVTGALVADGTYKVWVEFTWNHGATGVGTTTTSLQFTKGPSIDSQTLANTAFFTGVSLTWTPSSGVSVQDVDKKDGINVYPNPSNGIVNIDFKESLNGTILIENTMGAKIYEEKVDISNSGIKTIDLSKFANGTYFVNIQKNNSKELQRFKVVLNK
jgi:hypothetical protein